MNITQAGIDLIKQFEGLVDGDPKTPGLDPYICPTGYVTIGYGRVLKDTDGTQLRGKAGLARAKVVHPNPITPEQAEEFLAVDLVFYQKGVADACEGIDLNDNQFSALVSFAYNLGVGSLQRSTLLKYLRAGQFDAAADEFPKWVKGTVNGKLETLAGLVRRREAERQLFLRPVPPKKPLVKSKTMIGGIAALVASTASVIPDITQHLQQADQMVTATGTHMDILKYALAGIAILGALTAVVSRVIAHFKTEE